MADAPAELRALVIPRPVKQAEEISTIKNWLGNCMASHKSCRIIQHGDPLTSLRGEEVTLPTRVVDVGPEGSTKPYLRLLETNGLKGVYLTLSHCWGTVNIETTTTDNLEAHKSSIDLASLTLNFQDAIHFTRRLGMQYLWIDSLCIIQDSSTDWEVESSRMAEIYHQSALTLSAANSAGATQGFLRQRTPSAQRAVRVECAHQHVFYINPPISNYDDDVEKGPLARRGWVLQERVLSRRNLFFGVDQSHWECQTSRFSENTPTVNQEITDISGGVSSFRSLFSLSPAGGGTTTASTGPRATLSNIFPQFPPEQKTVQSMKSPPKTDHEIKIYNLWYHLVGEFTKRSLTVGDDKLPALSGIVTVFSAALNNSRGGRQSTNADDDQSIYAAGLWAGDFERGLLWKNFGPTLEAQAKMRAPSWSWTCVDGPVQLGREMEGQVCDFRDARCEIGRGGGRDLFGKVETGRLRLTGRLGLVPVLETMGPAFQDGKGMYVLTNAILKDEKGREIGAGYLDKPSCVWEKGENDVWCLPVRHPGRGVGSGKLKVDCLLLCKVSWVPEQHEEEVLDVFWRLGTATLSLMGTDIDQLIAPFQAFLAGAEEKNIVIV